MIFQCQQQAWLVIWAYCRSAISYAWSWGHGLCTVCEQASLPCLHRLAFWEASAAISHALAILSVSIFQVSSRASLLHQVPFLGHLGLCILVQIYTLIWLCMPDLCRSNQGRRHPRFQSWAHRLQGLWFHCRLNEFPSDLGSRPFESRVRQDLWLLNSFHLNWYDSANLFLSNRIASLPQTACYALLPCCLLSSLADYNLDRGSSAQKDCALAPLQCAVSFWCSAWTRRGRSWAGPWLTKISCQGVVLSMHRHSNSCSTASAFKVASQYLLDQSVFLLMTMSPSHY